MKAEHVETLIRNCRAYEYEHGILRECTDVAEREQASIRTRCNLLQRRLALVKNLLGLVPNQESTVLTLHLVENRPWQDIMRSLEKGEHPEIVGMDRRTLQRAQGRALNRMTQFLRQRFGTTLDFLVDEGRG